MAVTPPLRMRMRGGHHIMSRPHPCWRAEDAGDVCPDRAASIVYQLHALQLKLRRDWRAKVKSIHICKPHPVW